MSRSGSERLGPGAARAGRDARPWRAALLGLAALFALSPVLLDLARHLVTSAWARPVLVMAILLVWAVARAPRTPPAPLPGAALVAAGLAIEIVAVGGGVPRFGRPAVSLVAAGLVISSGLAPARVAVLALWVVPPPTLLVAAASPALEGFWLQLAAAPWEGVRAAGVEARADGGVLVLGGEHGGLLAAFLLSGAGWLVGLRRGRGAAGCCAHAAAAFALGLLLQGLAILCAGALLAAGAAPAAAPVAGPLLWGLCAAAAPAALLLARRWEVA